MNGFPWGAAATLLLGIVASLPGMQRPAAEARLAAETMEPKVDLGVEPRSARRVSGLPQHGETMLRGEWTRR
jgi:hypothetical protein